MEVGRPALNPAVHLLVVARVQRIAAVLVGTELQREQRVLAPRNVGVDVDLVLRVGQMGEALATDGAQINLHSQMGKGKLSASFVDVRHSASTTVHPTGPSTYLRPGGKMDAPQLTLARGLRRAGELFRRAAEEVAALLVLQRPAARVVVGDADLEAAARVTFLRLAQHVAERVHRQVAAQVRLQIDDAWSLGLKIGVCKCEVLRRPEVSLLPLSPDCGPSSSFHPGAPIGAKPKA